MASGASGFLLKSDPLDRITGSICVTGEGARMLMRAEPVSIIVLKPTSLDANEPVAAGEAMQKSEGVFSWFKLFGGN